MDVYRSFGVCAYSKYIPHLPSSKLGPGKHACPEGQAKIATVQTRDKYDTVFVQEKLDGSSVKVGKVMGRIFAFTHKEHLASASPFLQHHLFADWVNKNILRFVQLLNEEEYVYGKWLLQAHGTRYHLKHEPFVFLDIITNSERVPYYEMCSRIERFDFIVPKLLHVGSACSIEQALEILGVYGHHGAIDPVEGAIWRIERNALMHSNRKERKLIVDFIVKYVRPDMQVGQFLTRKDGKEVWNIGTGL